MNLRRTIKQRTFYDDKDYHDPNLDQVRRPPPKSTKPTYTGQVIEYNPNLRPAVFPTIPLDQEVKEPAEETSALDSSNEGQDAGATPQPSTPPPDTANTLSHHPPSRCLSADSEHEESAFDMSSMYTSADQLEWSGRLRMPLGRSSSPERVMGCNGLGNPTFAKNWKRMVKLGRRTDQEMIEAEMATSDEDASEEPQERSVS